MSDTLVLTNCRVYDAPEGAPLVSVGVRDGRIESIGAPVEPGAGARVLDAGGGMIIPGLIDLHVHGAGGADVLDGSADALRTLSAALARLGTTAFLATAFPRPGNRHLEVAAAHVGADLGGATLLGIHLEGPFLNAEKRGGIPLDALAPYSRGALDEVLARSGGALRIMTIAPEIPGGIEAIERLTGAGVLPSFGHSAATYEETKAGLEAGIRRATHLFNAMAGLHHRAPGPLPALLERDDVTVELISDDVHVSRPVVRFTARAFGLERCNLVTDAMRTAGLPDGRYRYGDRDFEAREGSARYLDGTLIGTSLGLLEIVSRFQAYTGCSFAAAVDAASRLPARVLGLERKGSIAVGNDADLVLLDADRSVRATVVGGRVVFER